MLIWILAGLVGLVIGIITTHHVEQWTSSGVGAGAGLLVWFLISVAIHTILT